MLDWLFNSNVKQISRDIFRLRLWNLNAIFIISRLKLPFSNDRLLHYDVVILWTIALLAMINVMNFLRFWFLENSFLALKNSNIKSTREICDRKKYPYALFIVMSDAMPAQSINYGEKHERREKYFHLTSVFSFSAIEFFQLNVISSVHKLHQLFSFFHRCQPFIIQPEDFNNNSIVLTPQHFFSAESFLSTKFFR